MALELDGASATQPADLAVLVALIRRSYFRVGICCRCMSVTDKGTSDLVGLREVRAVWLWTLATGWGVRGRFSPGNKTFLSRAIDMVRYPGYADSGKIFQRPLRM